MNIPFDILIFRQMKAYLKSSSLRKAALMVHFSLQSLHCVICFTLLVLMLTFILSLQALSKTLITDELLYLKAQFALLAPNKNGLITLDNIRSVRTFSLSHTL